jgi:hypothetical protein
VKPIPSFRVCPECSERLSSDARQCACGWKDASLSNKRTVDPFHGKCSWFDGTDRCRFPGAMSHGLKGDGKLLCAFHFFNGDPTHGARIVKASFDWDGSPEDYLRLRKEFATRPTVVAHPGGEGVGAIPTAIRDLVQGFRIRREAPKGDLGEP